MKNIDEMYPVSAVRSYTGDNTEDLILRFSTMPEEDPNIREAVVFDLDTV